MYPDFSEEKKLWSQGYTIVVGLDEAGRGPLAGPVVAGAVFVTSDEIVMPKMQDSKKLSEKQREFFYEQLTSHKDITWGVGIVSEKMIDKINILEATKLAMQKAIDDAKVKPDFLLLDGNFTLDLRKVAFAKGSSVPKQKPIVKGDSKVFSITAAGIIAKVTRDRIMQKMHKKYPEYGFNKHKGYGTSFHIKQLKTLGATKIHRKTFFPVSSLA